LQDEPRVSGQVLVYDPFVSKRWREGRTSGNSLGELCDPTLPFAPVTDHSKPDQCRSHREDEGRAFLVNAA
jgi:hypothetical protein